MCGTQTANLAAHQHCPSFPVAYLGSTATPGRMTCTKRKLERPFHEPVLLMMLIYIDCKWLSDCHVLPDMCNHVYIYRVRNKAPQRGYRYIILYIYIYTYIIYIYIYIYMYIVSRGCSHCGKYIVNDLRFFSTH